MQPCHASCDTCDGPNPGDCVSCHTGSTLQDEDSDGIGRCVEDSGAVDLDCIGSWTACTSACEAAADRQWIETQAPSGAGSACPQTAEACAPGEGDCSQPAPAPAPYNEVVGETPVPTARCDTAVVVAHVQGLLDNPSQPYAALDGDSNYEACLDMARYMQSEGKRLMITGSCGDEAMCDFGDLVLWFTGARAGEQGVNALSPSLVLSLSLSLCAPLGTAQARLSGPLSPTAPMTRRQASPTPCAA